MLELIESLSLVSGTLVIVGASGGLAFAWARVSNRFVCWAAALATPFLLSYCLYWSPVWLGASRSEYSVWAGAFIIAWFLIGALAAGIIVLLVRRHLRASARRTDA